MFVLVNGLLIDGTGLKPVEKATIEVDGTRITNVGVGKSYPEKVAVFDLKGLVVMPGLIDCHVHFGGVVKPKPGQTPVMDMASSNSFASARKQSIENGVTSIRSLGDFFPDMIRLRDKIASGKLKGPRIFNAGPIFTAKGGSPAATVYAGYPYIIEHCSRQVADAKTGREEIKKVAEGGVDCIKILVGNMDYWHYPEKVAKISWDVVEALIDEAHKHNLRVTVHVEYSPDAIIAVRAGADSIEHLIEVGTDHTDLEVPDELIKMMVDRGTYLVPTLTVHWYFLKMLPQLPRTYSAVSKGVKRLYDAGVKIAVGTDAGAPKNPFGKAVHKEMELMVGLGMSPMAAIMAATKIAAENLGKGNELGTIEKGKLADLIVVSGDPITQIVDTKNIKLVVKDGKVLVDKLGLPSISNS